MRTDIARRAQSKSENMREKMLEAKETIQSEKQTKLEISAGKFRHLLSAIENTTTVPNKQIL